MKYPTFRRDEHFDDFHGTKVADPYRWLEDPDTEETKFFVSEQNKIFEEYKRSLEKRDALLDNMKNFFDYPKYGCPKKHGKFYYYSHNPGLLNQSIIYQQVRKRLS